MEEVSEVIILFHLRVIKKEILTTRTMKGIRVTLYNVMQDLLNKLYFNVRQKKKESMIPFWLLRRDNLSICGWFMLNTFLDIGCL